MLNTYDQGQDEKDQDTTLKTILTSHIRLRGRESREKSLLSLIQLADCIQAKKKTSSQETLATYGVRIIEKHPRKWIFMAHRVLSRTLLRGSQLEGSKIEELLLRLPGGTQMPAENLRQADSGDHAAVRSLHPTGRAASFPSDVARFAAVSKTEKPAQRPAAPNNQ